MTPARLWGDDPAPAIPSGGGDGFDAVVVGSGPNGLIGAITLAAAGRRVLLLEGAEEFGGGLRSFTLDGAVCDMCATVLPLARASKAFRDLDLPVEWAEPAIQAAHPLDGQDAVLVYRDEALTAAGLTGDETGRGPGGDGPGTTAPPERRDARAWRATVGAAARAGTPLTDTLLSPLSIPRAPISVARFGALGVLPATTLAGRVFEGERAQAVFAGMAAHSMLDLRAPITGGYGLLLAALAHSTGWPLVRGGSRRLAEALIARFRQLGGTAVSGRPVTSLDDIPNTPVTLLDITPRQVLALAGDRLPGRYRSALRRFRYGPGAFKLDWVLSGPVPWRDPRVALAGTVHLGGTLEEIAAAEAAVAGNRHPERPFVLAVQPCAADPSRAPEGRHVLWAYCHVPHGSDRDMTRQIEDQIERFAPGFRDLVTARAVHGPAALEQHNPNLVGGDIGGGSAALTQFVSRPVLKPNPWATPLDGVYLCSASTPPGAGVHGMGGYHAANLALRRSQ
jgi:phytoene dehydrogenase-like protein